ncbi:MAG: DUF302 domain-containing protein [Chromatiales bacterium]|nr:DUF302 domain-containing protein [Chromatiales bacterium]
MKFNLAPWALVLALFMVSAPVAANGDSLAGDPIRVVTVESEFEYVLEDVKLAVTGRGLNIANTLHASDMLNRTARDLGFMKDVYSHAESVEFCSAVISHKLAAANPANLVLCPFTIGVYVLTDDPGHVHIAYRVPTGMPGSQAATDLVQSLLDDIVAEVAQ